MKPVPYYKNCAILQMILILSTKKYIESIQYCGRKMQFYYFVEIKHTINRKTIL